MKPTYYVILRLKAAQEFASFGRFYLGNDFVFIEKVFEAMWGKQN